MRFYSRCHTDVQRGARKVLRACIRARDEARCADPRNLSDELREQQANIMRCLARSIDTFAAARTDAQLLAAIHLSVQLTAVFDDDETPAKARARGHVH